MSGEDRRSLGVGWVALGLFFLSGCTTVAQVTTWSDESCRQKVKDQLNLSSRMRVNKGISRIAWP